MRSPFSFGGDSSTSYARKRFPHIIKFCQGKRLKFYIALSLTIVSGTHWFQDWSSDRILGSPVQTSSCGNTLLRYWSKGNVTCDPRKGPGTHKSDWRMAKWPPSALLVICSDRLYLCNLRVSVCKIVQLSSTKPSLPQSYGCLVHHR